MRKGRDLIGKPIVTYDTGEQVGKVADLLFDLGNNQLLGVDFSDGEAPPALSGAPFDNVRALGADAVIIASRTMIQPSDQHGESIRRLQYDLKPKPLTVFTTDGRNLGSLVDVYFDEHSGAIQGYEVAGEAFATASFGTSFVPASQQVKVGAEIVFVPAETVTLMQESESEPSAVPVLRGEPESGGRKFFEATPSSVSPPQTFEGTRGRRVRCAVRTDDGLIIAAQGQIVTDAVIECARTHHTEQALQEAIVHPRDRHTTGGNSHSLLDRTRERVREETSHLVANTEKVWDKVKESVTHLVHRSGEHREAQSAATHEPTHVTPLPTEQVESETRVSNDRRP